MHVYLFYLLIYYNNLSHELMFLPSWPGIDGTPLRLETDILPTSAPAFKIMDVSKRDAVGLRLAESAAKATKERKKAASLAARYI